MIDLSEVPEFAGVSIVGIGEGEFLFTMVDADKTPVATRRITRDGLVGLFVHTGHILNPEAVMNAWGPQA